MSAKMIEEEKLIGKLYAQIAELMNRINKLESELAKLANRSDKPSIKNMECK
jgi:uncharacterized coiled-coil protein SlyX